MARFSLRSATLWAHKHFCHLVNVLDVEGVKVVHANGHAGGVVCFGMVEQCEQTRVIHLISCDADFEEDLQLSELCIEHAVPNSFLKLCGVSLGLSCAAVWAKTKMHRQASRQTQKVIVLVKLNNTTFVSQPFWKFANTIHQRLCR